MDCSGIFTTHNLRAAHQWAATLNLPPDDQAELYLLIAGLSQKPLSKPELELTMLELELTSSPRRTNTDSPLRCDPSRIGLDCYSLKLQIVQCAGSLRPVSFSTDRPKAQEVDRMSASDLESAKPAAFYFNWLQRNKLAHRIAASLLQKSSALYQLEAIVREANVNLLEVLAQIASQSSHKLVWSMAQLQVNSSNRDANIDNSRHDNQDELDKSTALHYTRPKWRPASKLAKRLRLCANLDKRREHSGDSGISLDREDLVSADGALESLRRHLSFKSSARYQLIVSHSIELFDWLIETSNLFNLVRLPVHTGKTETKQLSPRQLRLLACVECQTLRSSLRFKWITKCLLFAYEYSRMSGQVDSNSSLLDELQNDATKAARLPQLVDHHQDISCEANQTYGFNQLAILMGLLVRTRLLEPALNRWCSQMEELAHPNANGPQMFASMELFEDSGQRLQVSKVSDEVKATLCFVVDELVSICERLPRLESQLNSLNGPIEGPGAYIVVLHEGDDLVRQTKRRLEKLVDSLKPLHTYCNIDSKLEQKQLSSNNNRTVDWIHSHYLLALNLVNQLRGADSAQLEIAPSATSICEYQDDRLVQLKLACDQIRQLDRVQGQLMLNAPRYSDLAGLLRLDCEPLKCALVRCLRKERLLLARLRCDDQIRLMERIRLQLDEIELGCDLETAIEDYLNERWQARNQAPVDSEQRLILTSDDLADDDDELGVLAGQQTQPGVLDKQPTTLSEPEVRHSASPNLETNEVSQPESKDEEELLVALEGGNVAAQRQQQQMLALATGPATPTDANQNSDGTGVLGGQERRIAPLVESRLLVGRYAHLARVLEQELDQLKADVHLAMEGLVFQSELSLDVASAESQPSFANDPNRAHEDELVVELALRSRELPQTLRMALQRLEMSRSALMALNGARSKVLSKLTLEFHRLMLAMADRCLAPAEKEAGALDEFSPGLQKNSSNFQEDPDCGRHLVAIQQLDSIQESADLARKLHIRHGYLECQNQVLARELDLLKEANLAAQISRLHTCNQLRTGSSVDLEPSGSARALILSSWDEGVKLLAALWCLAEEFETQQVKWLNSDTKRLEFGAVESRFKLFQERFEQLRFDLQESGRLLESRGARSAFLDSLKLNTRELARKLSQFQLEHKPVLRFLTNRYLVESHWRQLAGLLAGQQDSDTLVAKATAARACTTLAQFLELPGLERVPVREFDRLDRRAAIEHELEMFLKIESGSQLSRRRGPIAKLDGWLSGWTDAELELAAVRLLEARLPAEYGLDCERLANELVATHCLVRRHLQLTGELGLETCSLGRLGEAKIRSLGGPLLTVRSQTHLASSKQITPSLFVELLRLFINNLLSEGQLIGQKMSTLSNSKARIQAHLDDIDALTARLDWVHQNELSSAGVRVERALVQLERNTVQLELEREILATREAAASEQQRDALRIRDDCIRQISERAIPALRAATQALDCLDKRSLRALRCLRPRPPEPVRLVVEAVCLLRSCRLASAELEPERHFDALNGRVRLDYWPAARRQLMGTHSSRFLADLRALDKRTIPSHLMRLIRRNYLSREHFRLPLIERVSREAALLARWLIAVDVFDRVINVVRPNYARYVDAERQLASLLAELSARGRQIEAIGFELQRTDESARDQLSKRVSLVDSLEQADRQLVQVRQSRARLHQMLIGCRTRLDRLERKQRRLVHRCLATASATVYIDALSWDQRAALARQLTGAQARSGTRFLISQQLDPSNDNAA